MGLDAIEADIRKKNEEKVNSTISNAEKEAKNIVNKAKERLFEMKKMRVLEAQRVTGEYESREIAQANLNARKEILGAKREAVEKLYQKIEEKFLQLSPSEKKELLDALIQRAKRELPKAKFIFCNSADKGVVSELCPKFGLKFEGTVECKGGIIVETENREVRIDYTYESLLAEFGKVSMEEAAGQLFAGQK